MDELKLVLIGVVAVALILAAIGITAIMADTLTNDEHNQLPRCDTVEDVLVGIGDFYNGRWDDYVCWRQR